MTTLRFAPHPAQQVIFNSPARFKVCACGRRFGKTVLAVMMCIVEALKTKSDAGIPLGQDSEVVYFGVTLKQAIRNSWHLFKQYGAPISSKILENTAVLTLQNGVRIRLLGMDNPDDARGMKMRFAVLDEYADMPEHAWKEIIRPALIDTKGGALFIGTPKGKNHFYRIFMNALQKPEPEDPTKKNPWRQYEAFNFTTGDNTTIDKEELDDTAAEYTNGSDALYEQEIEAKFVSKGGKLFNSDQFQVATEPKEGTYHIAVDLAGFSKEDGKRNGEIAQRDETAIAIVKVDGHNWWCKEIQHGRWDVRRTAYNIVKAVADNACVSVGIEKGALKNAVEPYLTDYMQQFNRFFNVVPLTHGNQRKADRIQWALQGRLQKGQITFGKGEYLDVLIDQAVDFPSKLSHDDLVDALAYIDQLAENIYYDEDDFPDEWEALDDVSGY